MRKKITFTVGLLFSTLLIGLYIFQVNSLTALAYRAAQKEQQLFQTQASQRRTPVSRASSSVLQRFGATRKTAKF